MQNEKPISQIYAEEGYAWAEAEAKASILEDSKSAALSKMILKMQLENPELAFNKAEAEVKAKTEWRDKLEEISEARKEANMLKVRLKSIEMAYGEWMAESANERLQARL